MVRSSPPERRRRRMVSPHSSRSSGRKAHRKLHRSKTMFEGGHAEEMRRVKWTGDTRGQRLENTQWKRDEK